MNTKEQLHLIVRTSMPYQVIVSIESDHYSCTNRDYETVVPALWCMGGKRALSDTTSYRYVSTSDQQSRGEAGVSFYLYNDGCKPWESTKNMKAYLERFGKIHTLKDRLELIANDPFIADQLTA